MLNLSSFLLMAPPPANGEGGMGSMLPSILMFAAIILIFYFLMIRPQQKRQKELQNMIQALQAGDNVVTTSGIHGIIEQVNEKTIVLKVDNTKITFEKSAIVAKV
jgi:preprotein translocase subunit YajC